MDAAELIAKLRKAVGRSGAVEALEIIREIDVFSLNADGQLPHPMPLAGPDFLVEVLDALIRQANKP